MWFIYVFFPPSLDAVPVCDGDHEGLLSGGRAEPTQTHADPQQRAAGQDKHSHLIHTHLMCTYQIDFYYSTRASRLFWRCFLYKIVILRSWSNQWINVVFYLQIYKGAFYWGQIRKLKLSARFKLKNIIRFNEKTETLLQQEETVSYWL